MLMSIEQAIADSSLTGGIINCTEFLPPADALTVPRDITLTGTLNLSGNNRGIGLNLQEGSELRDLTVNSSTITNRVIQNEDYVTLNNVEVNCMGHQPDVFRSEDQIDVRIDGFSVTGEHWNGVQIRNINRLGAKHSLKNICVRDYIQRGFFVIGRTLGIKVDGIDVREHKFTSKTNAVFQPISFQAPDLDSHYHKLADIKNLYASGYANHPVGAKKGARSNTADNISFHRMLDSVIDGFVTTHGGEIGLNVSRRCEGVVVRNGVARNNDLIGVSTGDSSGKNYDITYENIVAIDNGKIVDGDHNRDRFSTGLWSHDVDGCYYKNCHSSTTDGTQVNSAILTDHKQFTQQNCEFPQGILEYDYP